MFSLIVHLQHVIETDPLIVSFIMLRNVVGIVSGGSSGLGAAAASYIVRNGGRVVRLNEHLRFGGQCVVNHDFFVLFPKVSLDPFLISNILVLNVRLHFF